MPAISADTSTNLFFIVVDHSTYNNLGWGNVAGLGGRWADNRGYALLPASFSVETAAHELGHAFGLQHDFNSGANIMSYGPGWSRLAACSAGMLSVHPYFNPAIPIRGFQHGYDVGDFNSPSVELISPMRYSAGAASFFRSVQDYRFRKQGPSPGDIFPQNEIPPFSCGIPGSKIV